MNLHPDNAERLQQELAAAKRDLKLALGSEIVLLDEIERKNREIVELKQAEQRLAAALGDLKLALASEKVLLDELDKKNRELTELSITDGLTGLYNHRYIQERLEFEV
jgi:PleD family two-component response regulator